MAALQIIKRTQLAFLSTAAGVQLKSGFLTLPPAAELFPSAQYS
jgi:hypothetical protein